MKKLIYLFLAVLLVASAITGCKKDNDNGTIRLSMTDAPIDADGIEAVYINITDIQYHLSGDDFVSFDDFEGPVSFNLLDLTRGATELLGSLEMPPGTYTQLRFILDAPEMGSGPPTTPGCYIEFIDGTTQPLFVPSGGNTGFKGVGMFRVPSNGTVEVTADFDVRKSVLKAGITPHYILKPAIRLVVDDQAGKIVGSVTNIPEGRDIVIFSYEEGVYTLSEASDPETEESRFPNAISSDPVDDTGSYHLAFLAPKAYDLVVVALLDGEFDQVHGVVEGVVVESGKTTVQSIDIAEL